MITDAELTVLYGHGLKPETAMRVIDEVRRQKFLAQEWERLAGDSVKLLLAVRELCETPTFRWNNPGYDRILDLLDG